MQRKGGGWRPEFFSVCPEGTPDIFFHFLHRVPVRSAGVGISHHRSPMTGFEATGAMTGNRRLGVFLYFIRSATGEQACWDYFVFYSRERWGASGEQAPWYFFVFCSECDGGASVLGLFCILFEGEMGSERLCIYLSFIFNLNVTCACAIGWSGRPTTGFEAAGVISCCCAT